MTQTATQIRTKMNQFLNEIWEHTSLPEFGQPSDRVIYQQLVVPKEDDDLATLRAKLYLLSLASAKLPDLDADTAQYIQYYTQQVDYEEHRPNYTTITANDLPF